MCGDQRIDPNQSLRTTTQLIRAWDARAYLDTSRESWISRHRLRCGVHDVAAKNSNTRQIADLRRETNPV